MNLVFDKVSWIVTKDDVFSVNLIYKALESGLNVSFDKLCGLVCSQRLAYSLGKLLGIRFNF